MGGSIDCIVTPIAYVSWPLLSFRALPNPKKYKLYREKASDGTSQPQKRQKKEDKTEDVRLRLTTADNQSPLPAADSTTTMDASIIVIAFMTWSTTRTQQQWGSV